MRLRPVLFDLLVAAGVAGLTSLGLLTAGSPQAAAALGYAMAVAVVFRRRWPLTTMAVVSSTALLQVVLFPTLVDPLPYDAAVLVAMYSVVKYGRTMRDAYLAAAVVTVGIVIMVVRHPQPTWLLQALWYVGVSGGVWLLGHALRNRRIYVATLEEKAATLEREREHLARIAVADERAAIARELHDVVAHSLSVMIVQADGGGYALDRDPDLARRALRTVGETGREALEDMRRLVDVLRGPRLEADDARAPVTLDRLDPLVERARSAGVTVDVDVAGERPALPPALEVSSVPDRPGGADQCAAARRGPAPTRGSACATPRRRFRCRWWTTAAGRPDRSASSRRRARAGRHARAGERPRWRVDRRARPAGAGRSRPRCRVTGRR